MPNTLITPTALTRESLRVLHQKLTFIGSINRQYDDQFAKKDAKIGANLNIRLPNQFTVNTGPNLNVTDIVEQYTTLQVQKQAHVDMSFTSVDLTLSLDEFSERYIDPAMSVLAATMEADAMSMVFDVYQQINNQGSPMTMAQVLAGRKQLVDALTPNGMRSMNLNTQDNADLVNANKGLFQDSQAIAKQYREGYMGRTGGFDFMESTLWPTMVPGSRAGYVVNGAGQTGSILNVKTGNGNAVVGDVFTIQGVYQVHPETKAVTTRLQQFVVTLAYAGGAGAIAISPAIVTAGARQNVSAAPADSAPITFAGAAGTPHGLSLAYHKDAFTFATCDLIMPEGVDFSSRQVKDGISMRIVRQYTINNDALPCRIDVLYGWKTLRAQLASRSANN